MGISDLRHAGRFSALIGLTGGLASGKSTALAYLKSLGAVVVEADGLAHAAYAKDGGPAYRPLVATFGEGILHDTDEIDRAALGALVFNKPDALARLQAIVWPATEALVMSALTRQANQHAASSSSSFCIGVVEAALLIEAGWHEAVDEVWVTVPVLGPGAEDEAVRRAVERSNGAFAAEAARARIAAQMSQAARIIHPSVTAVIDTSGPREATQTQLKAAWDRTLRRIGSQQTKVTEQSCLAPHR